MLVMHLHAQCTYQVMMTTYEEHSGHHYAVNSDEEEESHTEVTARTGQAQHLSAAAGKKDVVGVDIP
jgi:hypothetical protein